MTSCREIVMPLSFFQFMSNLEQYVCRTLDIWSVMLTFSLTVSFYVRKAENALRYYFCAKIITSSKTLLTSEILRQSLD